MYATREGLQYNAYNPNTYHREEWERPFDPSKHESEGIAFGQEPLAGPEFVAVAAVVVAEACPFVGTYPVVAFAAAVAAAFPVVAVVAACLDLACPFVAFPSVAAFPVAVGPTYFATVVFVVATVECSRQFVDRFVRIDLDLT